MSPAVSSTFKCLDTVGWATSTLADLSWQNSVPIAGDVAAEVSKLKSLDGPLLQIHGSGTLIQALLANDLIDEFRLCTFPVFVGCGKRLFQTGTRPANLDLVKSESTPAGVIMAIYRRNF